MAGLVFIVLAILVVVSALFSWASTNLLKRLHGFVLLHLFHDMSKTPWSVSLFHATSIFAGALTSWVMVVLTIEKGISNSVFYDLFGYQYRFLDLYGVSGLYFGLYLPLVFMLGLVLHGFLRAKVVTKLMIFSSLAVIALLLVAGWAAWDSSLHKNDSMMYLGFGRKLYDPRFARPDGPEFELGAGMRIYIKGFRDQNIAPGTEVLIHFSPRKEKMEHRKFRTLWAPDDFKLSPWGSFSVIEGGSNGYWVMGKVDEKGDIDYGIGAFTSADKRVKRIPGHSFNHGWLGVDVTPAKKLVIKEIYIGERPYD